MKANKGFTLIELLAVIVILAIIALIATPTILGVIETARRGSAEQSALGYIDAIEKQVAIDMLDPTTAVITIPDNGVVTVPVASLTVKGQTPESGSVTINNETGIISTGSLQIKMSGTTYCVAYNGTTNKATATKGAC